MELYSTVYKLVYCVNNSSCSYFTADSWHHVMSSKIWIFNSQHTFCCR